MIEKNLHSANWLKAIQSLDYSYNILGWLTGLNNWEDMNIEEDVFAMKLQYHEPDVNLNASGQFNGNISAVTWTFDPSAAKGYGYAYDALNRIESGNFKSKTGTTWTDPLSQDVSYKYDRNGNILELSRYGNSTAKIDELTYGYVGNKLSWVNDHDSGGDNTLGFIDNYSSVSTSDPEYLYDFNGNMTVDKNKGISGPDTDFNKLPQITQI